jgi:glucose/arabinose dehydrogenase
MQPDNTLIHTWQTRAARGSPRRGACHDYSSGHSEHELLQPAIYIVTADGTKSPAVMGTPPVDGRGQDRLLDVESGPDYATSKLISYWTYYEPREGGMVWP